VPRNINSKSSSEEGRQRLMRDFQNLSDEMENLLSNFFKDKHQSAPYLGHGFTPCIDVFETEAEIVCVLDLAGVAIQDLKARVDAGTLYISGLRREVAGFERRHYHKMELDFGGFERTFTLPEPVKASSMKIENQGGLCLIRLPKVVVGLRPSQPTLDLVDPDLRR
jgi:HSP20 family protein